MNQKLIAEFEHVDTSDAQVRWYLKKLEAQRVYVDQRLEELRRKTATAKVLSLVLAIAFAALSVLAAILLALIA